MFFINSCRLWVSLLVLTSVGACAGPDALLAKNKNAEAAYDKAINDLKDGAYPEALAGFAEVKTKFPYSKYAALSDLRIADTHFARDKFIEAIDAYRQFVKMHPAHDQVPYAMWRIGESYAAQTPEDWWFMPPVAEKDQADVRLAVSAYQDFIDHYPASEYVPKAREKIIACRRRLADHELYVAEFYWKRDKWQAAAARAEGIAKDYPDVGLGAQALLLAAQARVKAGEPALARIAAQKLLETYPKSNEAKTGELLLRTLPPASPTSPSSGG